ncbi:MAG: AI-2E family transporter [Clostridia bacterium]|nr:AI-2E family transporter [Clostridia bacterium]
MSTLEGEARAWVWWKQGKWWALAALAAAGLFFFRGLIWALLFQVLLGAAIAWALSPLCKRFENRLGRSMAALFALGLLLLGITALLTLLLPPLVHQIALLGEQARPLAQQLRGLADGVSAGLQGMGLPGLWDEGIWQQAGRFAADAIQGAARQMGGLAVGLSRIVVAVVLAYYFLRDREFFLQRAAMLVPLAYRRRALLAAAAMRREVGGYLCGQGVVSVFVGTLTALGLLCIGMPAWLALGAWMMLFDLIPYFGPVLGAIPIFLFSLSGGLARVLWAMGVVIAVQQIENNILSPRILSGYTGLHPVEVMLALSAGGMLWGVWGMLFALPILVAVRGAWRVFRYTDGSEERGKQYELKFKNS